MEVDNQEGSDNDGLPVGDFDNFKGDSDSDSNDDDDEDDNNDTNNDDGDDDGDDD
jgi:hypothetical protein